MSVCMAFCEMCGDEATYDSPKLLCDSCWWDWVDEGNSAIEPGCQILMRRFDDHVDNCEECTRLLLSEGSYCNIGRSLEESWLDTVE